MTRTRRSLLQLLAAVPLAAALPPPHCLPDAGDALPSFVLPRAQWDAQPPGDGMRPHQIDRITLHHTGPPAWHGTPPPAAYLRAIQSFHMGPDRRWSDIAYHLLIDLDGTVWEGRSLALAGDTATAYDPTGHALIALLGDYGVQHPNLAQRDAIVATVRWFMNTYGLTVATLRGHRDYAATACPGDNLAALLVAGGIAP